MNKKNHEGRGNSSAVEKRGEMERNLGDFSQDLGLLSMDEGTERNEG